MAEAVYDDEANYEDPVVKVDTIGNLEGAKRAFFNNQTDEFMRELTSVTTPYRYFRAVYKFADEFAGRAAFIASNFNRNLVREFGEHRKYFFCAFRCFADSVENKNYTYESYWIVNTPADLETIIGSRLHDFEVEEMTDISQFVSGFNRREMKETEPMVSQEYVH